MAKFYVIKEERCAKCSGGGIVQHPSWTAYWDAIAKGIISNSGSDERKFFAERGIYLTKNYPPEEIACPDCQGTGVRSRKFELLDALRELSVDLKLIR